MALGDLFKITLFQELLGEQMINTFTYRQAGSSVVTPALLLGSGFQTTVLPKIQAIQVTLVKYIRILSQNLITPADNWEDVTPTPFQGLVSASSLPSFVAASFRSSRPDLSKRYSYKRFSGIPQTWQEDNTWLEVSVNTPFGDLSTAMTTILGSGSGHSFTPCQISTTYPGGVPTYTHKYDITSWVDQEDIATQLSRRKGRGD